MLTVSSRAVVALFATNVLHTYFFKTAWLVISQCCYLVGTMIIIIAMFVTQGNYEAVVLALVLFVLL